MLIFKLEKLQDKTRSCLISFTQFHQFFTFAPFAFSFCVFIFIYYDYLLTRPFESKLGTWHTLPYILQNVFSKNTDIVLRSHSAVTVSGNVSLARYHSLLCSLYSHFVSCSADSLLALFHPGPGFNPGSHIVFSHHVCIFLFVCLKSGTVSQPLSSLTLTILKSTGSYFIPQFGFIWCFLMFRFKLWLFGSSAIGMMGVLRASYQEAYDVGLSQDWWC